MRPWVIVPINTHLLQDETLVHCSLTRLENPDLTFEVEFESDMYEVCVRLRPYFRQFLERVSEMFEVCVFLWGARGRGGLEVCVRLRPYFRQFLERVDQ